MNMIETVKTDELTPEMLRLALLRGYPVHLYSSFTVSSTRQGIADIWPATWTAAGLRLHNSRRIKSQQASRFMLNVYGQRVIKDVHGRRVVDLAGC